MQFRILIILVFFVITGVKSQIPYYFNNIYQQGNNFAAGMTILEYEDGYIGYGGSESISTNGQKILLYKLNYNGEVESWELFGEDNYNYFYGNVGGAMIETNDDNFAISFHYNNNSETFGSLIKIDEALDTIWQRHYHPAYKTIIVNCNQTSDNGFILTGWVWASEEDWSDALLIKTDSMGVYQWHKLYDDNGLADKGSNVIQTPDGGYLMGGFTFYPPDDHTMDAMIIKTDSLGNEQWTQYYGNPNVDDDMAHMAMADDGNYLVATVYGVNETSNSDRRGRTWFLKVNEDGNIIDEVKIGDINRSQWIKNFRKTEDGYIASGFFVDSTIINYKGFLLKIDNNLDSIWMRKYSYFTNSYDFNLCYDVSPTSDNGFIAVGQARPDMGGNNKMWVVKVDSMGCDTAGCFIVDIDERLMTEENEGLRVWPNPTTGQVTLSLSKCEFRVGENKIIRVYNSQGLKVEEIKIPDGVESLELDASGYLNGLYYLQLIISGQVLETVKFIKN